MANQTQDFTAIFKDFAGSFPVDTKAVEDMFKGQSELSEKLSAVAITAAQNSTELSAKWTNDTLTKMNGLSGAKADPADYTKSMTDFASASAEAAAENIAAFAEIAKKVQAETMELFMAAGKSASKDVAAAAKKATAK